MENIVESVKKEVLMRCKAHKEKTGDDYITHIDSVVRNALELADKYNADREIVELGALLHDIAVPSEFS